MSSDPPTFGIKGSLDVLQNSVLHGDLNTLGNLDIGGTAVIAGTLVVTGNCNLAGTVFASTNQPLNLNIVNIADLTVSDAITTSGFTATAHSALASATMSGQLIVNNSLVSNGPVTLGSAASDVTTITGIATLQQTLSTTGLASLHGGLSTAQVECTTLTASGAAILSSISHFVGAATLDSTLSCAGLSTLAAVQVNGEAAFAQNVVVAAGKTFTAAGPAIFSSTAAVSGLLSSSAGLTVSSGTTSLQALGVKGISTFTGNLSLSNGSTFTVGTGASTFAGSLGVTGASTFAATSANSLNVSGASSLAGVTTSGTLTVASGLTASSTLSVAGATSSAGGSWSGLTNFNNNSVWSSGYGLTVTDTLASFGGPVRITGLTTLNGDAVLSSGKNLTVGGTCTVTGSSTLSSATVSTALACAAGSSATFGGSLHAVSAVLDGGLTVANASTFSGSLEAATLHSLGAVTADSSLTVTGNAAVTGTLRAVAASTLQGGVTVTSGIISDTLNVSGVSTLAGVSTTNLTVAGILATGTAATNINGNLTVAGTSTLQGNTTIAAVAQLQVLGSTVLSNVTSAAGSTAAFVNTAVSGSATFVNTHATGTGTVDGALSSGSLTTGAVSGSSLAASSTLQVAAASQLNGGLTVVGNSVLQATGTQALTVNGVLTVASGSNTTVDTLTANGVATLKSNASVAGTLSAVGATQLGGALQVGGLSTFVQSVTVPDITATSSTVNGNSIVTGSSTLQGVSCATLTSSGDLRYAGTLYQNSFPIKFGPLGVNFNPPAINILSGVNVVASQIQLSLDPVQQNPLGLYGFMIPQIGALTITVQLSASSSVSVVVAQVSQPQLISRVLLYCYGLDETQTPTSLAGQPASGSTTDYEVYGLTAGGQYTVGLYYSNDIGSAPTFYQTNLNFPTAGAPAAPIITVSGDTPTNSYEGFIFTLTASVTDASNPAQSPQPAVSKFVVSYAETSSIGDHPSVDSGTVTTKTYSTPLQLLRAATVYSASAVCYNKVHASSVSPQSNVYTLYTGYTDAAYSKGVSLTDGAMLAAPLQRFPAAQYISRSNVALAASDILTMQSWSLALSGLRFNYEPHPPHGQTVSTWTSTIGGAGSDVASVSSYWSDSVTKTTTATICRVIVGAPKDANTGGEVGFFKIVPTLTAQVNNVPASYTAYTMQVAQVLREAGGWSYSSGTVSYLPSTAQLHSYANSLTFYVDDAVNSPVVSVCKEKRINRVPLTSVSISGIATLPQSLSALTTILSLGMTFVGRKWYQVGTAALVSGAVNGVVANTSTVCAPMYNDLGLTQAIDPSTNYAQTNTAYRSVTASLNTAGLAAGQIYEQVPYSAVATNIVGASNTFAATLSYFRYDPTSLQHPHLTSSNGQSPVYGERILLSDSANPYSVVTGASSYDHSQLIVGNSTATYNSAAGLYNGAYSGGGGPWSSNWAARDYSMSAGSSFPDYSSSSSSVRYATFRYFGLNSSSSFQHISVTLDSPSNSDAHDILYKYVDNVNGSSTTVWKNLLQPSVGLITTGADGSGGRFAASSSATITSTTVPVNDLGTIYIRIAMPSTSTFSFAGVRINDFISGAPFLASAAPPALVGTEPVYNLGVAGTVPWASSSANFPDKTAQFIWNRANAADSSPGGGVPAGTVHFASQLYVAGTSTPTQYTFNCFVDNLGVLKINGVTVANIYQIILTQSVTLNPGNNLIDVLATNTAQGPAGLLISVTDPAGNIVLQTNSTYWVSYGSAP